MKTSKFMVNMIKTVYAAGILIFAVLVALFLFGKNIVPFPDAMIPYSLRDYAFIGLAAGTIPLFLVSLAVCQRGGSKERAGKKHRVILIFLPSLICGVCLLIALGLVVFMLFQGVMRAAGAGG